MSIYESNPDAAPDTNFEPGTLEHLVAGNRGRLLDPRRTPVTVTDVRVDTGMFTVRIDGFEDRGALWDVLFEHVDRYQFERDASRASPADVADFRAAIDRLDQPLVIEAPADAATDTTRRLDDAQRHAVAWLDGESRFLADGSTLPDHDERRGPPTLFDDLERYMTARDLADIEDAFARQFVSNPYAGELVKGHRIVLAELGLVPFVGTVVRDPDLFSGSWTRERRAAHVVARLGFVRALLDALGLERVQLYRGLSSPDGLHPPDNRTFVSATFSRAVALSHFDAYPGEASRALLAAAVPARRLFMTYLETAAMNDAFREAEAVLLYEMDALF